MNKGLYLSLTLSFEGEKRGTVNKKAVLCG